MKPIHADAGERLLGEWKARGVRLVRTDDVVRGKLVAAA
jgi:hypothetical protein